MRLLISVVAADSADCTADLNLIEGTMDISPQEPHLYPPCTWHIVNKVIFNLLLKLFAFLLHIHIAG